ncbi:MAG: DUF3426 domain-containing protein [Burkholderiaceae bacterium]|jgi:predicted Zn finger-like uncharacterized protein|nr:DUF3426 domain-containing protein [Burkholderiaceae bacterium]
MSQVTRCPACATRFKVVADQLRISQGWVRCGVCHEVFDASQDLQPLPTPAAAPVVAEGQPAHPVKHGDLHEDSEDQDIREFRESMWLPMPPASAAKEPVHEAPPAAMAPVAAPPGPAHGLEPGPVQNPVPGLSPASGSATAQAGQPLADAGHELPASTLAEEVAAEAVQRLPEPVATSVAAQAEPRPGPQPGSVAESTLHAAPHASAEPDQEPASDALAATHFPSARTEGGDQAQDDDAREPSLPAPEYSRWPDSESQGGSSAELPEAEPGFVRQARRKAFWRKPAVRGLLLLASLVAAAVLAAQVAWQQRDALAVQHPALAPSLQALCSMAGCTLQPRRQIGDVVIGSSGFRQTPRSGQYQWSLSLENRSDLPVAMPAVELTLTDAQDKLLLRRVIRLDQLGAPAQIEARGEWSVTAPVEVRDLQAEVAGYRALVFYP